MSCHIVIQQTSKLPWHKLGIVQHCSPSFITASTSPTSYIACIWMDGCSPFIVWLAHPAKDNVHQCTKILIFLSLTSSCDSGTSLRTREWHDLVWYSHKGSRFCPPIQSLHAHPSMPHFWWHRAEFQHEKEFLLWQCGYQVHLWIWQLMEPHFQMLSLWLPLLPFLCVVDDHK